MGIGGIGGVLQTPYLYNTNRVTANSLNPIQAIGPDVVRAPKTDYSELSGTWGQSAENENPLRPYETRNFEDVLAMQMAQGLQNATRLFG